MAGKRKLIWSLYPSYLIIILMALLAVAWYASRSMKQFYLQQIKTELETRAYLVDKLLGSDDLEKRTSAVDKLCKETGKKISTRITVILPSGLVIGDSEKNPSLMDNHADRPEIKRALSGSIGSSTRYSYTLKKEMMYVAVPVNRNGSIAAVVRASMPVTAISQVLRSIYLEIGLAGLVVALAAALIGFYVSRRISRPLEEMKQGAERFSDGDLGFRLHVPDSEEVGALANAMNQMAAQLDERIRMITRQRNELEAILSSMVEAVIIVDLKERILRLNQAAGNLLGVKKEESQGRSIQEVTRNVDLQKFVKRTLSTRVPVEEDITLLNGGERFLRAIGSLLTGEEKKDIGALIVLHDLTGMKRLENMRREFVANVSHELKTPITSIKGFVETLKDGAVNDKANVERFLDIVSSHADRLNAIVEDLLSLSRIEKEEELGQIHLEKEKINDIIDTALTLHQSKAEEKKIQIEIHCPESIAAMMNPALMEQAISNLFDNAIKFSDSGSRIEVRAQRIDGEVVIKVTDSGYGIPSEHLPRIFERFYRVDKARSRDLGGTGLGLAIVKHIVQAHHGRVEVESTTGKGSTFYIYLPSE